VTLYIHPKSLLPEKRIYLNVAKRYGARIGVRIIGRMRGRDILRVVVSIDAPPEILGALRRLGVKTTSKPIHAYVTRKIIGELVYREKEPIPIGIGEHGEILSVDASRPIAVDGRRYAVVIADTPVLWIDLKGDGPPPGFREITGFSVPESPTKIHMLADELSRMLRARKETILTVLKGGSEVMGDMEIEIANPLKDMFDWGILMRERPRYWEKTYIDFSGLPHRMRNIVLQTTTVVWDYWLVIESPRAWRWIWDTVGHRRHTVLVCEKARGFDAPNIVVGDNLVRKINFGGSIIIVEKKLIPFWRLGE